MTPEHVSPGRESVSRVPFTCTLDCGSRCELVAHVQDGRLLRIDTPHQRSDTIDRPRLVPCARGRAHRQLLETPERVLHPLRRVEPRGAGEFEQVSWNDALDEVAERLTRVRDTRGAEAVLHATGAGSITGRGLSGASASRRFFSFWGPVTEASGNESYHCAEVAARWMLGDVIPGSDRATLLHARLIILWGMNPAETRMGPNTAYFIAIARERGARVILIDPRYTDSAILADQWIPIRPGTDAALAAALAYVIETENLVSDFVGTHTTGYDVYRRYLLGEDDGVAKTPEWAAPITGLASGTIRQLAREYACTTPAALLPGWGPQRSLYGEQIARAWITLACMSGNVGLPGGGLASVGTRRNVIPVGELPRGPYAMGRHLSASAWARELLEGDLRPPIGLAYIVASNVINRSPQTPDNARALQQLDFVVVNEQFLTPTARCADIVLPICTDLERPDLVTSWGHDSHLFYSRQALPPASESRTDYWVFSRLAERLDFGSQYTCGRNEEQWLDHLLQTGDLPTADLRRDGIMRTDGKPRVALEQFRADPLTFPLSTPSGRIEIACPQAGAYGLPSIASYVEAGACADPDRHPLQLVTPHSRLRSNSCVHANPWLRRLEVHAIWMNPLDAEERGIGHGELVAVTNQFGTSILPAKVTERIRPGVVCVYQGAWYEPTEGGIDAGGCANVLTGWRESPTGGIATHSACVEVTRWDG